MLHLVGGDLNSGAGRGAYWLHQGLIDLGVDSKVLTNSKSHFPDKTVFSVASTSFGKILRPIYRKLDKLLLRGKAKSNFSAGVFGYFLSNNELLDWADIVHLHWVNGGFVSLLGLSRIKKPIIWTLRDMWAFTGGCHYSFDCDRFKIGCGSCPVLGNSNRRDLSFFINRLKNRVFPKGATIVGVSNWLSGCAKRSYLLKNYDIRTIYNGINLDDFFPIDRQLAKSALGIETGKKIILIGAQHIDDKYKGFRKFLDALRFLDPDQYFIVFFGRLSPEVLSTLSFESVNFGFLNDNSSLRLVYSCADVFVAPSLMEAFGKTLIEALACGTPVVCFNSGGPSEIINHKINGYKAIPFLEKDLSSGINWVCTTKIERSVLVNDVMARFDIKRIAKEYKELYLLKYNQ